LRERTGIAVVGAGPCGLGVGIAARQAGVPCLIFDKGSLTDALVRFPRNMTFFSTADRLELGGVPFIVAGEKPSRVDALRYYRRVASHFDLDCRLYEEVVAISGCAGDFTLYTRRPDGAGAEYGAEAVVVATGYFDTPRLLGVPGEEMGKVRHYYDEGYPYYRQRCLVVGGGNSAVDAALDLYRSGADVTLVHFLDRLDPGVKPWILPDIQNRLASGAIRARWRTRVVEIRPRSVLLCNEDTGVLEEIDNDWVFAMTGFVPDPRLLRDLEVEIDPATGVPAHDPATLQTNVAGVYVAGVVVAGHDANRIFIENGREHGPRIVRAFMSARGAPAR